MDKKKEKKKMGRPTDAVKEKRIGIRVDENTYTKLNEISKKYSKTKTILLREGIDIILKKYE